MKNRHAQALGKLGGLARAQRLTEEQRRLASQHANEVKRKRAEIRRKLNESQSSEPLRPHSKKR